MDKKRQIITDAAIAVNGARIVAVGKTSEMSSRFHNAEIIDGQGLLAMPGFIDTHVHTDQTIVRSVADDMSWEPYLYKRIFPILKERTTDDAVASLKLCMADMIKSGTTCFVDSMVHSRFEFDALAQAVSDFGLRGVLAKYVMPQKAIGEVTRNIDSGSYKSEKESLSSLVNSFEKWHHQVDGRLKVWIGPLVPRDPQTCSPEFYQAVSKMAGELNTGITIHLGAEKEDIPFFEENFGLKPAEFAFQNGLTGTNVLMINACWMNNDEIDLLVRTNTRLAHSPSANMKMASGIAKVLRMRNSGGVVSLGTDSGANNNTHDMIREMKPASLLHNIANMNASALSAEDVLEMATIDGARAIGWESEIGSIEVGKQADIILIDLNQPHTMPVYDPVANLVYAGHGGNVVASMVAGKFLMRDCKLTQIDELTLLSEAQKIGSSLLQEAGIEVRSEWPII